MARIPEAEIERLKNEVAVERLVEASGIELKKSGRDWIAKCPFHADDTSSLVVTPSKNLWHCFGCGAAGGPIDWVMKLQGVSFRHAVEQLREGVAASGVAALAADNGGVARARVKRTVKTLAAPVAFDADDHALLNQVVGYYHERLQAAPDAQAYLASRGLTHPEMVSAFRLGVADRTLGLRLPDGNRRAGADIRAQLAKVGILRESGHEHFNGSLVVPVFDEGGNVVEVYGRKLLDNLRTGTPKHLYLPAREGRSRGVFNLAALAASKEVILCEALIDAMTFWCAGYRNVTSAYGTEGFTEEHLAAFKRHGTERVLIAYDRDDAGERGAAKVAELLMAQGIECFRVQFPKGMDANEYAQKVQPASKSLGVLIRKAVWLGKGETPMRPGSTPVVNTAAAKACPEPGRREQAPTPAEEVQAAHSLAAAPAADPLPASPMPTTARELPIEVREREQGREVTLTLGEGKQARRYRVRGMAKNLAVDVLKVNLMVAAMGREGETFHVDTLDLYAARQRAHYIAQASSEIGVDERILKADLGRVLLALEQLQDETIAKTLTAEPKVQMGDAEQQAALALLQSPQLIERILADYAACGLVGEETNKLVGYLAAVSRKLDKPLGVVIQSSSAAGKSSLMDAVLAFVPDEEKVKYSAMTGQSLFYMGETNLKHKALAIVEEEGASRASYALKLLQSEGELTIASTGKDPQSGNLITQQYRVEGPVALLFTTTARDLDEELMNRCLVLAVDEGREQTRAIHERQRARRTLEGLFAQRDKTSLVALHQNAQRLLRPLDVFNPYARLLTFPDQTTRLRRDHEKYLTLIDTIAFVHQHQRRVKTERRGEQHVEYIEATLADIALANRIAHDVLGRSLDELPPQTRRLAKLIDQYVVRECERIKARRCDQRFSRRSLREAIAWGDTQLKLHLARLVELEYLVAHRTRTGGHEYELVYELADDENTLRFPGLADIEALACAYDGARSGQNDPWPGSGRGVAGPRPGGGRGAQNAAAPATARVPGDPGEEGGKTHCSTPMHKSTSYTQADAAASLAAGV